MKTKRTEAEKQSLAEEARMSSVKTVAERYGVDQSMIYRYLKAYPKTEEKTVELNWEAGKKNTETQLKELVADLMLEIRQLRNN